MNNHAVALSLLPSPQRDAEENQKEKAKVLVALKTAEQNGKWDENSSDNTDRNNLQLAKFSPSSANLAPE